MAIVQTAQRRGPRIPGTTTTIVLFLLPLLAGILLFQFVPLAVALYNSTLNLNITNPDAAKPVGLKNYADLLHNLRFAHALLNSLLYTVGKLVIQLPLAFG